MSHSNRREFLQKALHFSLLTGFAGLSSQGAAAVLGKIPSDMPLGKSIYDFKGQVKVDGQSCTFDTLVKANSLVETGSNSFVIFVVGKDAHILRENSQLQLEGSSDVETGLKLITGKALNVFGHREQEKVKITTSTATIGIRGTAVYAESASDVSYLCTCYGQTQIQALSDLSVTEQLSTMHHESPRFIYKNPQAGKLIEPAPMFNHTDEELMLIEALVGRTPPFSSLRDAYGRPRRKY